MELTQLANLGEFIGGVAVLVTLAYLAVQVRQGNQVNASAVRQGFYDYTQRQMLHSIDSAEFNALFHKAWFTNESLTEGESTQMLRLLQGIMVGYQGAFFQYRSGALRSEDWEMARGLLRSFWVFPGAAKLAIWEQLKAGRFLDEGFVVEVEQLRREAPEPIQI